MKWINVQDKLPVKKYYPPVVCGHDKEGWTDSAYFTDERAFINCEGCEIWPTHWAILPPPPRREFKYKTIRTVAIIVIAAVGVLAAVAVVEGISNLFFGG